MPDKTTWDRDDERIETVKCPKCGWIEEVTLDWNEFDGFYYLCPRCDDTPYCQVVERDDQCTHVILG
jgi:ssDNA-binding Zn-finger/Zn-ribbon topoisomerase 1